MASSVQLIHQKSNKEKTMTVTKPILTDETFSAKMEAQNHLLQHGVAALDVLAADKRAELVTNVAALAELASKGELLEVMGYGDEMHPEWVDGSTHYNPAMNLCHESDELLEDGETIHGCFFEWDKTIPFGAQFSHQRAFTAVMYKVASALTAGTKYYWLRQSDSKYIGFTCPTGGIAANQWLNFQNNKIEIYDSNCRYVGKVDATVGASGSGTSLGDAPVLAAGSYYFSFAANWGSHVVKDDIVSFTTTADLQFGEKLCGCYGAPDQAKTNWKVYPVTGDGKTIGTALDVSNDNTGTNLGVMAAETRNVAGTFPLNGYQEMAYGYNRYAFSALRQWLNSGLAKDNWWTAMDAFDVRPDYLSTKDGFLAGYDENVKRYFKPIKVITVANNADGNVEDVTYDRVFLSSLEQMYAEPMFSGKEGDYWEYYKRLLGRTTPAPLWQTYPRYIKYALDSPTSAQYCFRRSAYRYASTGVMYVGSSGYLNNLNASYAYRCAPSVFLSE